jgi:hypothetical protein
VRLLNILTNQKPLLLAKEAGINLFYTTRGRPKGTKNRANTRDKFAFEYLQAPKCGKCKMPGHNIRTCTQ